MEGNYLKEVKNGVQISIILVPNSESDRIAGLDPWRGKVKIHVKAPPSGGRANQALIDFLGNVFGVREIKIISGLHSREKVVLIMGVSKKEVEERIFNVGGKKT